MNLSIRGIYYMGRADLHTHTKYSALGIFPIFGFYYPESATEPEALVMEAERKGLDIVCITDHNTIDGALRVKHRENVVVGEEVTTKDGEIIGLFLSETVAPNMSAMETIDRIHEQGGIAIVPHPYSVICHSLGDKMLSLDVDGIEVFNAYHRDGYSNRMAQIDSAHADKAQVGGSDAHYIEMVGNGYTFFEGKDSEDLYKALKNRRTRGAGTLTPLLQGIKWSICITKYGLRNLLGDSADFDLARTAKKKKVVGVLGGVIFLLPPVAMSCGLLSDLIVKKMGEKRWSDFEKKVIYSKNA
jgi:hypothetical protein